MGFFARLDPATRDRLVASHLNVPLDQVPKEHEPAYANARRMFAEDRWVMAKACYANEVEAIGTLLGWGAPLDHLKAPNGMGEDSNPLSWAIYGIQSATTRPNTLAALDFLLDRGADPNYMASHAGRTVLTCPMHSAADVPDALERLIERGGDVNCRTHNGWGILDQWAWAACNADKKTRPTYLRALDIMIAAGLDMHRPMANGSSFLVACWAATGWRVVLPELIARGFDPHAKGAGKEPSLVGHLQKKTRNGKGGEMAQRLVAEFAAQELEQSTPTARAPGSKPRL